MDRQVIVINYGELNLKGKNKPDFIRTLQKNIKRALIDFVTNIEIKGTHDHVYLYLVNIDEGKLNAILEILKDVSGIFSFGIGIEVKTDPDTIIQKAFTMAKDAGKTAKTFKVISKRIDKSFYPISEQLNRDVAKVILQKTELKVDVHSPDVPLNIKIYPQNTYIYWRTEYGAGGLPIGMGKKALMLISGGIDSPVASYLLMRRGVSLDFIHFASPPYTSNGVIDKITDLLRILNRYQERIRVFVVPFTKIQETIYGKTDESLCITILRRMMYRVSHKVAEKYGHLALANGESIGQVASQTLASMNVINAVTCLPIIRPLATYDKHDIMTIARRLGTYEISIRPFTDCCTIFAPINPKTSPNIIDVVKQETKADYTSLIEEAVENIEILRIHDDEPNSSELEALLK